MCLGACWLDSAQQLLVKRPRYPGWLYVRRAKYYSSLLRPKSLSPSHLSLLLSTNLIPIASYRIIIISLLGLIIMCSKSTVQRLNMMSFADLCWYSVVFRKGLFSSSFLKIYKYIFYLFICFVWKQTEAWRTNLQMSCRPCSSVLVSCHSLA